MHLDRRKLLILLLAVTAYFGWEHLARSSGEVATLHATAGIEDIYAQVWVVDERPYVWLRAEKPTRRWLEAIEENPQVVLHRGDQRIPCTAEVRHDQGAVQHVDALFRAKYALADQVRAHLPRDPVPVRLLPRS